jgi:hypothetical protein
MNERLLANSLLALIAVAAASLTGCSPGGPVASAQPTPSATLAASPTAASSAPPSPSAPPASPDPLGEGDYVSPPLTAEMMVAAVEAHGLDPASARAFVAAEGFADNEVVMVRLADGELTLFQSMDGGAPRVGWRGDYEFVDANTLVAADDYPITYSFRWEGDALYMTVLKDLFPDPMDLIAQVALYESAPFTRVP